MGSLSSFNNKDAAKINFDSRFFLIVSITLIATSGVFSINPIIPNIAQSLNVPTEQIGMLMTSFLIPTTFGCFIFGALADRIGTKKILIPSLILFGLAGILCASANSFRSLLEWRFLSGIGAASLEALELTLISELYSGKMLTSAMGINSAMIGVAATIYPILGGMLAEFSWRYVFLLSALAFPVAFLVATKLKLSNKSHKTEKVNLKVYFQTTWKNVKNPQVLGLLITVFSMFIIELGACYIFLPVYMQKSLGASSAEIGILLASESIAFALVASQLALLTRWLNEKTLISLGFVICAIALLIIPIIHSVWLILIPSFLFGISQAISLPPLQAMLAEKAPEGYRGGFMALNVTVQSFGRALGPLFSGITFGVVGIQGVFYANAALAIITIVILNLLFTRKDKTYKHCKI
ncbi:major facilitator transporter [Calothrix sp. PCC 7716]|nr:major facilitator transporter [Calothrix sp. PCC 7716]